MMYMGGLHDVHGTLVTDVHGTLVTDVPWLHGVYGVVT